MIAAGGAPMARRMPISCVRSFTSTSMMLLTPTMPASSVPRPTIHVSRSMPRMSFMAFSNSSPIERTHSARGSSGAMRLRAKSDCRTACSTSAGGRGRPATAMASTLSPRPRSCWASVMGIAICVSVLLPTLISPFFCNTPTTRK